MTLVQSLESYDANIRRKNFPPGKHYHLSEKPLPDIMKPRVPRNYMTQSGYEDGETPRISVAPTIDGALRGMSANLKGKTFFVYTLTTNGQIKSPTTEDVPDVKLTGEKWILGEAHLTLAGKIIIGESYGEGHEYKYGPHRAMLYDWSWEAIK